MFISTYDRVRLAELSYCLVGLNLVMEYVGGGEDDEEYDECSDDKYIFYMIIIDVCNKVLEILQKILSWV